MLCKQVVKQDYCLSVATMDGMMALEMASITVEEDSAALL